jgi:hypothetical protein
LKHRFLTKEARMATYAKQFLSGSTNGRLIKVIATTSPGTTIHTSVAGTSDIDEVWLWATNTSTSNVKLTLEYGGTTSPDDLIEVTILPKSGLTLIVQGLVLQNSLIIKAFAASANVINIGGYVNRVIA